MELDRRRFMQATGVGVAGLTAGNIVQGQYEASWDNPDEVIDLLYLGGVEDGAQHYSEDLVQVLAPYLLERGVKTHYTERQDDLNHETLSNYDAVMLYGNRLEPTEEQIDALETFVEDGGGFVPVHSASASFGAMDGNPDGLAERFTNLVGGGFDWHGHETMTTDRIEPDHPVFEGAEEIEAFEETYRHHNLADDIEVLAHGAGGDYEDGEDEPFTWVRTQGDGRVFYTAWGHDDGVWEEDGFKQLLHNAVRWSSGNEDSIGNHPELDNVEYTHIDEYGHSEVPYYQGDAPDEVSTDDDGVWDLVQDPMSVSDSLTHTITPAEFDLEYFVSEEQYADEVEGQILDMTFDAAGRCLIAVTKDYPNNGGDGNDAILICEDTDGDGIADEFEVFRDGLSIPLSIIPYKDGVLASEIGTEGQGSVVYYGDEDGDDVAEVEEEIFSGFGTGDTHSGLNQLHYGVDNWVYGVVGFETVNTDFGGESHSFQLELFRFKPDGSEMELVGPGASNMAGVKTNEEGLVFCSSATAGTDVSTYAAIPAAYYDYIEGYTGTTTVDIRGPNYSRTDNENRILPVNDRYRQVDQHDGFTAVTDHEFYTAREFPEQYWNKTAFVGEGTGQLLSTFYLEQEGAGYESVYHHNLVASNDEWVSPTYANTGPDGMVWMIDFYNFVFQHNPTPDGYTNGDGNAYETNKRDDEHSRLYRVTTGDDVDLHPQDLNNASPSELVDALTDDNKFWRRTAQRLLIERGETDVVDELVDLVQDTSTDEIGLNPGAIHALWTLEGLDALDETTSGGGDTLTHQNPADLDDVDDSVDHVIQWQGGDESGSGGEEIDVSDAVLDALTHPSAGVRLNALRVLPGDEQLREDILDNDLLNDEDGRVQMWALLKLAETPESHEAGEAVFEMIDDDDHLEDEVLPDAATIAGATHAAGFIDAYHAEYGDPADEDDDENEEMPNLLANPSFEDIDGDSPAGWSSTVWDGEAEFSVDDSVSRTGDYSVRIDSAEGSEADASWYQMVDVDQHTDYELVGYVQTENFDVTDGIGVMMNEHHTQETTNVVTDEETDDWQEVSMEFNSGSNDQFQINCLFGGWQMSTGTAWWDDVELRALEDDGEGLEAIYNRIDNHATDDDDGDDDDEVPDDAIEPGTTIELDGQTAGWVGISPESIEDDENPTLRLVEGETYELGWSGGDGAGHNIAIWDDNEDVVDDLATSQTSNPDDDQFLEFEASSEMVEYVCEPHEIVMRGDLEIVEAEE
ncbi:PVC-type heme-binding CxxCH protein [Natrialbaceae archaeon A-arb3/5]